MQIKQHFELLGLRVKDQITGVEGIVSSICFDLYGCIQVIINRGLDKDGKQLEQQWFDVVRISRLNNEPIIQQPNFEFGVKGPAEKPNCSKP